MNELMTLKQVAEACKISTSTLRNWNKKPRIPYVHPKGTKKILYRKSDVERFLFGTKDKDTFISPRGKADIEAFRRLAKKILK